MFKFGTSTEGTPLLIMMEHKITGIIYCQHDVLQPESYQEYLRLVSNEKHHVLDNCAHFPWVENPDDYYRLLQHLVNESTSLLDM